MGSVNITLSHILQFVCGTDEEPVLGFAKSPGILFVPIDIAFYPQQTHVSIISIYHTPVQLSLFPQMKHFLISMIMLSLEHFLELFEFVQKLNPYFHVVSYLLCVQKNRLLTRIPAEDIWVTNSKDIFSKLRSKQTEFRIEQFNAVAKRDLANSTKAK